MTLVQKSASDSNVSDAEALAFAQSWGKPVAPPPPPVDKCAHGIAAGEWCIECAIDHEDAEAKRLAAERYRQFVEHAERAEAAERARAIAENKLAAYQDFDRALPATAIPAPPSAVVAALPTMIANSKDKYEACADYVERTLESDGLLSFDTFRGAVMIQQGATQRPMTDTDLSAMRVIFEREKNFATVGKELMRDMCRLVAERRQFDSGQAWLDGLVWDGVPRVERFMSTHFGAADDDYTRAVGLYMWTGLAGRMLDPGCQLDMVIALLSGQGTKKSTGLAALVPEPDWFTDGLSLHKDDDNFKRLIRGKVVVEISELAGLSRADVNETKRNITRRREQWIEKWQIDQTTYPRRCMLFASTNEEQFLPPDETGQRRWLPVEVVELNRERIAADRDQMWAEGAAIWKTTGIAYAEAEHLATGRHKRHEARDVWESAIVTWLNTPTATGTPSERPLTISEVLRDACRLTIDRQDSKAEKRAAKVMRQLGYENQQSRVEGIKARWWVRRAPPPPPLSR